MSSSPLALQEQWRCVAPRATTAGDSWVHAPLQAKPANRWIWLGFFSSILVFFCFQICISPFSFLRFASLSSDWFSFCLFPFSNLFQVVGGKAKRLPATSFCRVWPAEMEENEVVWSSVSMEMGLDLGAPPCVGCCWRPVCAAGAERNRKRRRRCWEEALVLMEMKRSGKMERRLWSTSSVRKKALWG